VISAVREPIGLALSALFENHEHYFPNLEPITVPRCVELVQRHHHLERFQNWFDNELKPLTEIDVFQRPFPRRRTESAASRAGCCRQRTCAGRLKLACFAAQMFT
jgi:hypothetical protein